MSPFSFRHFKLVALCGLMFCYTYTTLAQNKLTGRVVNAVTKAPVPFANVFFANTTLGMSAREDGTFTLEGFPPGKYDLTVTSMGFRQFQQSLDFTIPHRQTVEIQIQENATELNEVVVKEENPNWENDYITFKKLFIGESSYASTCEILNPRGIHLYFDPELRIFTAHSKKPIEVINKALGMKVTYHLNSFEYNYKSSTFFITGIPQFQYLKPKNKAEQRRWINERHKAYYGSVMHFVRTLVQDSVTSAGFIVHKLYPVPNKQRLPTPVIEAGIKRNRITRTKNGVVVSSSDSLAYFMRMKNKPEFVDSVGEAVNVKQFVSKNNTIDYKGKIVVMYEREKEDLEYVQSQGRTYRGNQTSYLHLIGKPIVIYPNGYYESPTDLFLDGYWGWAEKIASLLPLDYQPELDVLQTTKK